MYLEQRVEILEKEVLTELRELRELKDLLREKLFPKEPEVTDKAKFMTVKKAASYLGLSGLTVRNYLNSGLLTRFDNPKGRNKIMVAVEELDKLKAQGVVP